MKPIIKNGLITIIRFYQQYLSALKGGPTCRFVPTCSAYAKTALLRYGVLRGGFLAVRRLLRCNPWNAGGIDPVPEHLDPPRILFAGREPRRTLRNRKG